MAVIFIIAIMGYQRYALRTRDMRNTCKTWAGNRNNKTTWHHTLKQILSGVFSSLNSQSKFHSHTKRVCIYLFYFYRPQSASKSKIAGRTVKKFLLNAHAL